MKIFNLIKAIVAWISMVIAYMVGGQGKIGDKEVGKGARRFGFPGIAILASIGSKFKWKHLAFLLFIPVFAMGYGQDSFLMGIFHNDALVRFVIGFLLSIPFIVFSISRWLWAFILLVIAFSIRAGSFGQVWGMDLLKEDFIRGGVLAGLVIINIFFPKCSSRN